MKIYAVGEKFIENLYSTGIHKDPKTNKVIQGTAQIVFNELTYDMVNSSFPADPGAKVKVFSHKEDARAYAEKLRNDYGRVHDAGGCVVLEANIDPRFIILIAQKDTKFELHGKQFSLKYSEVPRRDLINPVQATVLLPIANAPMLAYAYKSDNYLNFQCIYDGESSAQRVQPLEATRRTINAYLKLLKITHKNHAQATRLHDKLEKLEEATPAQLHSIIFKESQIAPSNMDAQYSAMIQVLLDNIHSPEMYAVPAHIARSASTLFAQKQAAVAVAVDAAALEEKHAVKGPRPPSTPYPR